MARALLTNVDGFGLGSFSSNAASLFLDQAYISAVQAGELISVTDRGSAASFFAPTATALSAELGNFAGGGQLTLPSDTDPTDAVASGVAPGFDITTPSSQAAFTGGNIVVYRVGTGVGGLVNTGNPVFLDEYTTSGTLVQSIALPTSASGANAAFFASGTASSEGLLTLSADGRYLLATGYASISASALNTTSSAVVNRVVARIDGSGTIDTTTQLNDFASANNPRGVASTNGTDIWVSGGAGGVRYTTLGSTTSTQLSTTLTNIRGVEIFGDQLYISTQSGSAVRVGTVGTGLPTTAGQTIANLPGFPTSGAPNAFFLADLTPSVAGVDTLYIADETGSGGQIQKYSLVGGTWTANGTIAASGVRGLTGVVSGTSVALYGTTGGSTPTGGGSIYALTDATGYNAAISGSLATIATASTNTAFRGIALAPQAGENQVASISVSPTSQNEGNSGSTTYTFTVTRTGGTSGALAFTANFAAVDTNAADFAGGTLPGTVNGTILAGQASATFTVNVAGDTTVESNENFRYTLASVSNGSAASATIGTAAATATIVNDDVAPLPNLTINDVTAAEGNSGTTTFTFTVSLSAPAPAGGVTFDIATANGTATAGSDYVARTLTTQTIAAGLTTYTFDVTVNGDTTVEPNETFFVNVTNATNATVVDGQGQGTITNDDVGESQLVSISVSPTSQTETNSGPRPYTFTVARTGGTTGALTFTANFSAGDTDAVDFSTGTLPGAVTLSIPDGLTSQIFTVFVQGDTTIELDENFAYTLVSASNSSAGSVTIGTATATATIVNDDALPPTLVSSTPADNATNFAIASNIVLTFDQNVQAGSGSVILRPATGADISIPIANAQITFSGNQVTINPTSDLRPGVAYDVIIASGVITNAFGGAFAGIVLDALDFTTSFTIPGGSQVAPFTIADPGTFTLLNGTTRTQTANGAVSVTATTGPVNVTIDGTLNDTASGQRAINYANNPINGTISVGASGSVQSLNIDAIRTQSVRGQIDLTNLGQIIASVTPFTPSFGGTNPGTGFAITYNAALGATGAPSTDFTTGGTINNGSAGNTTALIRADNGDAIRLGSHQTLNNYGTINGNGPVNDSSTNNVFNGANGNPNTSVATTYDISRGVRVNQAAATAVAINNFGTITGAQHGADVGVVDATNLIITNNAGGQIIGRNGSGIGADTTAAAANTVTVINSGLIRGDYAPAFDRAGYVTVDGDGDGVDIDGGATITNNVGGIIRSTGAGGFDSGGRANNSEALSIGGGQIANQGTIDGFNFGIVVNNDSNPNNSRSGSTATTILNYAGGTISGGTGFAIRLENKTGTAIDNDAITNYGTITGNGGVPTGTVLRQDNSADPGAVGTLDGVTYTAADAGSARFIRGDGAAIQTGEGVDTIDNYGTIVGNSGRAINLEGGNDQLTLRTGSSVTGRIDGGAGTDTLVLALDNRVAGNSQTGANSGVSTGSITNVINFENLTVQSGTWTIGLAQSYSGGVALNGGRLNLDAVVTAAITFGAGAQTLGINNSALGADPARTLGNAINGFGSDGDVLDFTGIPGGAATASYNATTGLLTLTSPANATLATINVGTGLGAFAFSVADDGNAGTAVSLVVNAGGTTGFAGTSVNDNYTGTPDNDFFNFSQGGDDRVSGGDGNDGFFFGAAFTAADRVDGGAGTNDQIGLQGNYSGVNALTLGTSTIANVEVIAVLPGFSYSITTIDANIAAGQTLTFFGTNLGVGDNFTVNASAETNGAVRMYGGLGTDNFTGGAGNDGFYFGPGRYSTATDVVDGGAGNNDQLALDGNFSGMLSGVRISNIEVLALLAGLAGDLATYNINFADTLVGAGQNFTVFALPVVTALQLDASAEADGNYSFIAGSAGDTLIGGAGNDTFFGGLGADVLTGGTGNDLFRYTAINESLVGSRDRITDFAAGDRIELTQIDADGNAGNGDTAFTFIGAGAFTNVAGQLHIIASGADWLVEGDVNGDGAADFQILVQGAQPLEAQFAL